MRFVRYGWRVVGYGRSVVLEFSDGFVIRTWRPKATASVNLPLDAFSLVARNHAKFIFSKAAPGWCCGAEGDL
jgi:hypothetical protein